jgi:hypothetical protein
MARAERRKRVRKREKAEDSGKGAPWRVRVSEEGEGRGRSEGRGVFPLGASKLRHHCSLHRYPRPIPLLFRPSCQGQTRSRRVTKPSALITKRSASVANARSAILCSVRSSSVDEEEGGEKEVEKGGRSTGAWRALYECWQCSNESI